MRKQWIGVAVVAIGLLAVTGCRSPFGSQNWPAFTMTPDTVELFSLARPDLLGLPAAYDFTDGGRKRVVVETPSSTGQWDVILTERQGQFVFLPASALSSVSSTAAVAAVSASTFDALKQAPAASSAMWQDSAAVPLSTNGIYTVRTRQTSSLYGVCVYYAKVEVIGMSEADGTVRFRYITDPNCNDTSFVPPNK